MACTLRHSQMTGEICERDTVTRSGQKLQNCESTLHGRYGLRPRRDSVVEILFPSIHRWKERPL